MPHRVFAEARGLLHVQTPYENSSCGNDTKAERKTPDRIEVVIAEAMMAKPVKKQSQQRRIPSHPKEYQRYECGNDKTKINHGVCKYGVRYL